MLLRHVGQSYPSRGRKSCPDTFELHQADRYILYQGDYKIHKGIVALPSVRFSRTFPRPEPLKYPKNLKTIGDHIRKRRMDKGLSQSKLGQIFMVSKDCVTNWENGRNTPQIGFYPRIISFLGYNPFLGDKSTLGNAIFAYRCEKGISAKNLGAAIGIGGCTVLAIEQNRCIPQKDTLRKIGAIIQYKL